jgi:hypothetical protein
LRVEFDITRASSLTERRAQLLHRGIRQKYDFVDAAQQFIAMTVALF